MTTTILDKLRNEGWYLSSDGLDKLSDNGNIKDAKTIIRKALDTDIREFGAPVELSNAKNFAGPVVLQISKARNISAPKSRPDSQAAPRMYKLTLTDGHSNYQAIEMSHIPSLVIAPGTKLLLRNARIVLGFVLINREDCEILGGKVGRLLENWEVSVLMPQYKRVTEDGPPPWVKFGENIKKLTNQDFKSLENKSKENTKENVEFQTQREDAIAEVSQGAIKKVFGGGVKTMAFNNPSDTNYSQRPTSQIIQRPSKRKGKEKHEAEIMEKPSQRVSLFDFLEDKLPVTVQSKNDNAVQQSYHNVFNASSLQSNFSNTNKSYKTPSFQKSKPLLETPRTQPYRNANKFRTPGNVDNPRSTAKPSETKYNNDRPTPETKYRNDRPPRFNRQNPEAARYNEPKSKPNTNNFINKLTNEMNNISLYNNRYENEKLNKRSVPAEYSKWRIGDRCKAKYWEDNKFYYAVIQDITNRTCVVKFTDFGNIEEVLQSDCVPLNSQRN